MAFNSRDTGGFNPFVSVDDRPIFPNDRKTLRVLVPIARSDYTIVDGYLVTFSGSYVVELVVGMIPAWPNRCYGPINPPETVTEEADVFFDLTLDLTDLGRRRLK